MSLRSSLARISFFLLLMISFSVIAFADTIRLKDGSIIKGHIVSFAGGKFTVSIGEGSRLKQLTFFASEIETITFDQPSEKPQNTASNRTTNSGATIVNTSSTTTKPPQVIVTDQTTRINPSVTIVDDDPVKVDPVKADPPPVVVTDSKIRTNGKATIASRPTNTRNSSNSGNTSNPVITQQKPVIPANSDKGSIDPIAWNIKVTADNTANGWTNSGWVVKKGQRIRVTGEGQVKLANGKTTSASGLGDLEDNQKLLKNVPTGALIAVIGDDNNDFIYIGAEREFTATRDGALFLGVNVGSLDGNSGAFDVKVEILPDKSN